MRCTRRRLLLNPARPRRSGLAPVLIKIVLRTPTSPSALTRPPFILQTASATWESCWTVHSPCGSILRRSRQRAFSTSVDFADYAVFSIYRAEAVGVRVCIDAHRLLQRRSRQPAGQSTRSVTASATRSSSVCGRPWATRSCHVYTHFVELVTNPSTNHLQTVYHDAFCVLRSDSSVYI